jgi:predicted transport protein
VITANPVRSASSVTVATHCPVSAEIASNIIWFTLPLNVTDYECLAENVFDEAITPDLSNQLTSEEPLEQPVRQPRRTPSPPPTTERAVTSFEDHIAYAEPTVRPILHELRRRVTALGPMIEENVTPAQRITYRLDHDFVEIKVQKKRLLIRVSDNGVPDPLNIAASIPKSDGWRHDAELAIYAVDLVDYVMPFIAASYRRELAPSNREGHVKNEHEACVSRVRS